MSIPSRFAIILLVAFLISFAAVVSIFEYQSRLDSRRMMTEKLLNVVQSNGLLLAKPLFEQDKQQLELIVATVLNDSDVESIKMIDRANSSTIKIGWNDELVDHPFEHTEKLQMIDGGSHQDIGSLSVRMSEERLHQQSLSRLVPLGILTLCLTIVGVVSGIATLRHTVGYPLRRFLLAIDTAVQTGEHESIVKARNDELGRVVDAYNLLSMQRQRHAVDLENSTKELSNSNSRLKREVDQRMHAQFKLDELARTDTLTDLPNRFGLELAAEQALIEARKSQSSIAVIFLDLDNFKGVNDSLGHTIGDQLLRDTVTRIKSCIPSKAVFARYGGDEFVILLPGFQTAEQAITIATAIVGVMSRPFPLENSNIVTGTSIGICSYPEHGDDFGVLLRNSDVAMYESKKNGRGQVTVYTPELSVAANERLELRMDLETGLLDDQFFLMFQPQLSIGEHTINKWEALIRWRHPDRGILLPHIFLPTAEHSNLIQRIDQLVLRKAIENCAALRDQGFNVTVAVNITATTLVNDQLVELIVELLTHHDLIPQSLCIEITETTVIEDFEKTLLITQEIRELGVRLSMDDFGTGYSSLNYLKRLPIDQLKLDRSFIVDIATNSASFAIVKSVIGLCQSLEIETVAEGVETQAQIKTLANLGCDNIQGYHISRPVEQEDMVQLLKKYEQLDANSASRYPRRIHNTA